MSEYIARDQGFQIYPNTVIDHLLKDVVSNVIQVAQ